MAARRGHARAARHLILLGAALVAVPAALSSHGAVRDKGPAWSPDGTLIAFTKAGNDFDEIWVARPDGTSHRKLTAAGARDTQASWSPDGRRIAFTSMLAGNWEIHVMDADGGNRMRLTSHPLHDTAPGWSPDGSQIAYQRGDEAGTSSEIRVMRADGSGDRVLAMGARNAAPSWSPDGSRVVFSSTRDGNWELYAMSADGSAVRRLTATPDRREDNPSWSPDGTRIAFAAGDDVRRDIYVVDADGSNERRLTRLARPVWDPKWSPDSGRIAFFEFPFPRATIYLVNADGSGLTPLFGRLAFGWLTVTKPTAGRPFSAILRVTGGGADVSVTCRASIAGRTLRLTANAFSSGQARCRWAVPRGAKGKRVVGSIAAAERGSRVARTFAVRVG